MPAPAPVNQGDDILASQYNDLLNFTKSERFAITQGASYTALADGWYTVAIATNQAALGLVTLYDGSTRMWSGFVSADGGIVEQAWSGGAPWEVRLVQETTNWRFEAWLAANEIIYVNVANPGGSSGWPEWATQIEPSPGGTQIDAMLTGAGRKRLYADPSTPVRSFSLGVLSPTHAMNVFSFFDSDVYSNDPTLSNYYGLLFDGDTSVDVYTRTTSSGTYVNAGYLSLDAGVDVSLHGVRVHYRRYLNDGTRSNVELTVSISTDGGVTWTDVGVAVDSRTGVVEHDVVCYFPPTVARYWRIKLRLKNASGNGLNVKIGTREFYLMGVAYTAMYNVPPGSTVEALDSAGNVIDSAVRAMSIFYPNEDSSGIDVYGSDFQYRLPLLLPYMGFLRPITSASRIRATLPNGKQLDFPTSHIVGWTGSNGLLVMDEV